MKAKNKKLNKNLQENGFAALKTKCYQKKYVPLQILWHFFLLDC